MHKCKSLLLFVQWLHLLVRVGCHCGWLGHAATYDCNIDRSVFHALFSASQQHLLPPEVGRLLPYCTIKLCACHMGSCWIYISHVALNRQSGPVQAPGQVPSIRDFMLVLMTQNRSWLRAQSPRHSTAMPLCKTTVPARVNAQALARQRAKA